MEHDALSGGFVLRVDSDHRPAGGTGPYLGWIGPTVGHSDPRGTPAVARRFSQRTSQMDGMIMAEVTTVPTIQFPKVRVPGRITISYQTPPTKTLRMARGTRYFHAKFISRS